MEDSYSLSKLVGEQLLENYSKVYGLKCHSLRSVGIWDAKQRDSLKERKPTSEWDEWLFTWVASEDLAAAHRLLMENAHSINPFGYYYCCSDDTDVLEPTLDIIKTYRPELMSVVREPLEGNAALFSNKLLKAVTGWRPKITWR